MSQHADLLGVRSVRTRPELALQAFRLPELRRLRDRLCTSVPEPEMHWGSAETASQWHGQPTRALLDQVLWGAPFAVYLIAMSSLEVHSLM